MTETYFVLEHYECQSCIWCKSEKAHYNAICAHCPYCTYSKKSEPSYMTKEMAESTGLIRKD